MERIAGGAGWLSSRRIMRLTLLDLPYCLSDDLRCLVHFAHLVDHFGLNIADGITSTRAVIEPIALKLSKMRFTTLASPELGTSFLSTAL